MSLAAERVGVVGAVNKNITANSKDGDSRNLNIGDNIYFRETIKSDSTGNGQLIFADKSALTVGPNSAVVIDEFVYNPKTSSGNMIMRGTKGTFRFIGGALSKKNAVKIKTPVGTIGIRGGIAIVDIAPNGATNATFVYGDQLTFQNLAGDFQSVTDRGVGLAVETPNDVPQIFRPTTAQMANQVQSLAGRPGTSAGAKVIPTDDVVDQKLEIESEIEGQDNENSSSINEGKEGDNKEAKKEGDEEGGEDGDKTADNKDEKGDKKESKTASKGKEGDDKRGPEDGKEPMNDEHGEGEHGEGEHMAEGEGPRDGEGGYMTEDGGYVDEEGNYHSPEEVAERKESEGSTGARGDGTRGDGTRGDGTRAGRAGPPVDDGGYMTEDGGYVDSEGNYHNPSEVKSYEAGQSGEQITLTEDGGYVDSEGNYHDSTELAAYRAGKTDGTDGGHNDGGYYGDGEYYGDEGGYYGDGTGPRGDGKPHAGRPGEPHHGGETKDGGAYYGDAGGYYDDGGYHGDGGYYGDDGGYYNDGSGDYYGGGDYYGDDPGRDTGGYLTADGGYIDGEGNYFTPGQVDDHLAQNGGHFDPVTGEYVNDVVGDTVNDASQTGAGAGPGLNRVTHTGLFRFTDSNGIIQHGRLEADDSELVDNFKIRLLVPSNDHGALRKDYAPGYSSIDDSDMGLGFNSSGWVYVSPNSSMYTYRLELDRPTLTSFGANEQNSFVIGTRVDSTPTSGKQFFDFLPDMNLYLSGSNNTFFDWNIANTNLLTGTSIPNPGNNNGILVDWGNEAFIGGYLDWNNAKLKLTYGDFADSAFAGVRRLDGDLYQYDGSSKQAEEGYIDVLGKNMFGTGSHVEGFVMGAGLDGQDNVRTPTVDAGNFSSNYHNATDDQVGYTAGFVMNDNNGTISYNSYWNTDKNKLKLDNQGTGEIQKLHVDVDKVSGGDTIQIDFENSQRAFIDSSTYALEVDHGDIPYGGKGVAVSSHLISNLGCSTCDFVHWGVWSVDYNVDNTGTNINVGHLVPYVAGTITDNINIPTIVNANYSGSVYGNILSGGNVTNHVGSMDAVITLGNGSSYISGGNLDITGFGGHNFENSGTISFTTTGPAKFANEAIQGTAGTTISSGAINGALFGPNAENLGGNFQFIESGGAEGTGVYLGDR